MAASKEELQTPIAIDIPKDEEIQNKLEAIHTESEKSNLEKIVITQEIFEQIKRSLAETVKSMEKNPSFFSRVAEYWGKLPLWQKILGGIALTIPTLIIGIAAHIGFLLAICGVTTVVYAGGGIILDDHHKCSTSVTESLQKGILNLADFLQLTIDALELIGKQLKVEIMKFIQENERLTTNINALSEQIDGIALQVGASSQINESLGETKEGLDKTAETLKEDVAKHTDMLRQNQKKLGHIIEAYNTSQKELAEKIAELNEIKKALGEELNTAKTIIDALTATVSQFAETIGNEEKQRAFQEKLDTFLLNKEASFIQVIERICDAEKKLDRVQKELESTNARYQELLEIQGKQIDRLAGLPSSPRIDQSLKGTTQLGQVLSRSGLYAVGKEPSSLSTGEEAHDLRYTDTINK